MTEGIAILLILGVILGLVVLAVCAFIFSLKWLWWIWILIIAGCIGGPIGLLIGIVILLLLIR